MSLNPPLAPSPDPPTSRLPLRLVLGLAAAIALDTVVQTVWKRAAGDLPDLQPGALGALVSTLFHKPIFLLVGLLIAAQMINWLKVLDDADVSYALPITALSYVSVAGVSALWLGEAVTPARMAGIALILAGVFLVSRTEHNTLGPAQTSPQTPPQTTPQTPEAP